MNLHWLADWANDRPGLVDVTLDDFWPGLGQSRQATQVDGAFTAKGREEIEQLLARVGKAVSDKDAFERRSAAS